MPTTRRTVLGTLAAAALTAAARPGAATAAPAGGATVLSGKRLDARTLDLTVRSTALAATVPVRLLLPPGWTPHPRRSWPVLYLLHGAEDDYTSWTRSTDVAALTAGLGLLVVMPAAGTLGFYSDWWNEGAGGPPKWETFHLSELRPLLERGYGAGPVRAVAGLSMGGFGALSYAGRHPGLFRAAASYSGLVHTTDTRGPGLIEAFLVKDGYRPDALWGAYPVRADLWSAHNPYDLARNLAAIPVFASAGNGQPGPLDPPGTPPSAAVEQPIGEMTAAFAGRMRAIGGRITADLYGPGTHNWPYWQRELHRSFPMLAAALGLPATRAAHR